MKQLTPQALTVLEKRYLRKDEKGQVIETPDEMFLRVASALGKDADQALDFYHLMADLDFLPNSPTLMNAGTGAGSLSACFVIPVEDSMEGITKASHDAAMVQKFGGGCIGGESIILTERGPIRAKDLVEGKMATKVYSYASKAKLTDIGAYHIIDHDTTVEVTFDTGSVMRASDFHPFFVWDGDKVIEKRADELVEGDAVIGSTRWCGSSELDLGGWGIGAIVSDGGFDKGGYRLRVCKNNEKFIQRCAEFLKRNYRHATDKRYSSDVWEVCAQGAEMVEFSKNFTDGVTCETKRLPVRVWSESVDYQASVLVGLLDGDGYYNKKGQFEYATVSDDLALDVLALAGVLGLRARDVVKKPRRQNEQPVHTIIFSRSVFLNETMRTLSVRHNPKHDVVSHGLIRLNNTVIRDSLSSSGVNLSGREVWKVGAEIDGYLIHVAKWLSKGMISRNHAAIMLRKIGDEVNAAAVHSAQIVKKAVKAGADTLYDLTVPGPQNYIAGTNGGFAVVHNTGFSLSRIRPKGSGISTTHGAACGPVAVLKYLSATSTLVTQGGKRDGANMGILRVDHPDIREFIHCKDSSVTGSTGDTLHNFNISVGITDEFMGAVKADEVFDLKFNGLYYDAVDARELWKEIIESAHKTGDPGVVFLDRINNGPANPVPSLGPIEATNPCLAGDTLIATVHEGHKTFAELAARGTDILVYAWSPVTKRPVVRWMRKPRLTRSNVPVLAVEFDSGLKVRCTPDHNFYSFRGEKVQAQSLRVGQSVRAYSTSIHRDGHLRAHGWDGVNNKATHQWVARMVWECEKCELSPADVVHHLNHNQRDNRIENLGITDPISHNSHHYPQRYENGFRTVGPLKDSTKQKISERLKGNPACIESGKRVAEWNRQNRWVQSAVNHKVVAIYPDGEADVYNGTVDDVHTYIVVDPQYQGTEPNTAFTGIVSANCGEQPLYPYDSCNLGSLNLGNFVRDDGTFDFERLKKATQVAVRLLDRVVSVNTFPLQEVADLNEKIRRIGLGVMGWHDALIKMRLPYASEEAVLLGARVMREIETEGHWESVRLGLELGSFPVFDDSIWNTEYTALRNSTITTIAPTGTISLIAGASSGIEPVFAWEYKHNGLEGRITETVKYPLYQQALDEGWYTPELFQSAMEIAPEWHLQHQAAFQAHTDNAVSKTINLPQSATVEDVKRCYEMAWDLGCKGVTIYRDGSKGSQVLETVKPVVIEPSLVSPEFMGEAYNAQHRPDILTAVSIKQPTPFGTAYLTITEDEGQPLELFATLGKAGSDVAGMLEAMCRVVSKQLRAANPGERRGILSSVRDQWGGIGGATTSGFGPSKVKSLPDALSRALSRYLDNEAPVGLPVALQQSWKMVYTPVGDKVAPLDSWVLDLCPDCQNYTLQHGEGCAKCLDCGYSKC